MKVSVKNCFPSLFSPKALKTASKNNHKATRNLLLKVVAFYEECKWKTADLIREELYLGVTWITL